MKNVMKNFKLSRRTVWIIVIILSVFKVLLTFKLPISINADQLFDDQLLFRYAESMLDGQWLGAYNNLTLVKGVSFSVFLVLCHLLMIPYTIGLALLNIGGAVVFTQAIKKKLPNQNIRFIIYLLLIYSPVQFTYLISQRAYRMAIIPDMVLLVFSFMLGMFWRKNESAKVLFPWSFGAGVSLAFFWYIREDSIWIAPFIGAIIVLMFLYFIFILKERKKLLLKTLITLIPVGCVLAATFGIGMINRHYYGMFVVNDRSGAEFGKMMSCLYSLEDKDKPDEVWISHKTVEEAMEVSPTLATAKDNLESSMHAWEGEEPIKGDLMAWVIRDAIQTYGYYNDAVSTNEFYRKVNQELEAAIDNGTLKKDHSFHFTSQSAGITTDKIPPLIHKSFSKMLEMSTYKECGVNNFVSCTGGFTAVRTVEAITQSYTTYPTQNNFELNGWLFAKNDNDVLTVNVVDKKNNVLDTLRFEPSPDVQTEYAQFKNAAQARFHVSLKNLKYKKIYLDVYVNGNLVSRHMKPANCDTAQFVGIMTSTRDDQHDDVIKYSKAYVDITNGLVSVYQKVSPLVDVLAVIGYLILMITVILDLIHRKYESFDIWIGTTGVLLSAVVLMFGVEFFCSWFNADMEHYISFYAAGVYYLLELSKYMAIVFGIQMITRFRAHVALKGSRQ